MINPRSFVGRFFNKYSFTLSNQNEKNNILKLIDLFRKYGIKERFIVLILEDFINNKYFNFIKFENIFIKINDKYYIEYELTDPESRILDSNLFINIPLIFLKKSYINLWEINDDFVKSFNYNSAIPLKLNNNTIPNAPEFLIIIKEYIGNNFKLSQIRELFHRLERKTDIIIGGIVIKKEKNLSKGVKELFVKQIEDEVISNYTFCITRRHINIRSDAI